MFDFEKLEVYKVVRDVNISVLSFLNKAKKIDPLFIDQWKRASLSIITNLAEGTGRIALNDKKHYYTMARGSVFECVALLDILYGMELVEQEKYDEFYAGYERSSKMLLAMYRSMNRDRIDRKE